MSAGGTSLAAVLAIASLPALAAECPTIPLGSRSEEFRCNSVVVKVTSLRLKTDPGKRATVEATAEAIEQPTLGTSYAATIILVSSPILEEIICNAEEPLFSLALDSCNVRLMLSPNADGTQTIACTKGAPVAASFCATPF